MIKIKLLLSLVGLLAMAGPAFAQGFYYKEVRKDDRIYVFNNAVRAQAFEASGEIGTGITRPGAGPNGETVVGDSERALQLFFFKHGISEAVPEPAPPVQTIAWSDGKTRITTNSAYLEISNRVQFRYTHEAPDRVSPLLGGTKATGDDRDSFRIRRAKMKFEGWFWIPPSVAPAPNTLPKLSYELQVNWPAVTTSGNPGALLEDATLTFDPAGSGKFRVVAGQFKVPFGRQEMTSSGNQQFIDRALVSNEYARGRDIGVALQGAVWQNKLEYRFGVFNGAGVTRSANDNDTVQVNGRLMWQPNGSQVLGQRAWVTGALYSESDFESTTVPLYALGVNFEHNDFHRTTAADDLKSDAIGFDGIYKFKGFSAAGEYFVRRRTPEVAPKFGSNGGYLQMGKLIDHARTWEVAFRYGRRDVSDRSDNDDITEVRGALSYYYRRHTLKLQMDFGRVQIGRSSTPGSRKDFEFRTQAQFIF